MDFNELRKQAVKFTQARNFLLIVVAFTAVNLILAAVEADWYFLFSAYAPLSIFYEGYWLAKEFANNAFMIAGLFLAAIVIAMYAACWLFANRARVLILVALILFGIDCLLYAWLILLYGLEPSEIIDILFHAWIIYSLVGGTIAWSKLRGVSNEDFTAILQGVNPAAAAQAQYESTEEQGGTGEYGKEVEEASEGNREEQWNASYRRDDQ